MHPTSTHSPAPSRFSISRISRIAACLLLLLLPQLASAGEAFTGQWTGAYANSTGERGPDSLLLVEASNGTLSGKWTGTIPIVGRRLNANTAQLTARTSKRAYQLTAVVRGNQMTMRYNATRLDSAGGYTGACSFQRK